MRYSSESCRPARSSCSMQTFAQIARADARRIEGLDDLEHFGDFLRRQVG